jgi:hypothetical protein
MKCVGDREALLAAMAQNDFDPYRRSHTLDPALEFRGGEGSTATARLAAFAPDRIDLEVASDAERPLVVAELAAPGWRWEGKRMKGKGKSEEEETILLPARTANDAFRATRVPAGEYRIALTYRPFSFRLGLYLTLVGALGVLVSVLAARNTGRMSGSPPAESKA